MCVLILFEDRTQSVSDRLSAIDLYLANCFCARAQVICGVRGSLIEVQTSEAALFVSGSVKGKQLCVVSWECGGGGGGGVSVRLEPSDDNPHRGTMMVIR